MRYCYQIADLTIAIEYQIKGYEKYLGREYGLLKLVESNAKENILIKIHNEKFLVPRKAKKIKDNFYKCCDGTLVQLFSAFDRHFWILYHSISNVELYIPYDEKDAAHKLINSFYEPRYIMCLTDFLHNQMLILMQLYFLNSGLAIFHCSSCLNSETGVVSVFTGQGQTGKSSIIQELVKDKSIKYCAEDFAFISKVGEIFGLPHQTRIKIKGLKDLQSSGIDKIGETINFVVYGMIAKRSVARHFSLEEMFYGGEFAKCGNVNRVFFLDRNCKNSTIEKMTVKDAVCISKNIIEIEIANIASSHNLLDAMKSIEMVKIDYDAFIEKIADIYQDFLENVSMIYKCELPFYDTIEEAVNEIHKQTKGI